MSYQIKLMINGKEQLYVRNEEPGLSDITNAMKVQQQQLRMQAREDGPTNKDFDDNEDNLANFAVKFWNAQFNKKAVEDGATASLGSLDSINAAIEDALGNNEDSEDAEPEKKSQTRTSNKRSTTSTTSTKQD